MGRQWGAASNTKTASTATDTTSRSSWMACPIPQWLIWFADSLSQNALIPVKIGESLIPKLCQRNDIIVEFNKLCQHIENYGDSDDRPPNIYRETATLEG